MRNYFHYLDAAAKRYGMDIQGAPRLALGGYSDDCHIFARLNVEVSGAYDSGEYEPIALRIVTPRGDVVVATCNYDCNGWVTTIALPAGSTVEGRDLYPRCPHGKHVDHYCVECGGAAKEHA